VWCCWVGWFVRLLLDTCTQDNLLRLSTRLDWARIWWLERLTAGWFDKDFLGRMGEPTTFCNRNGDRLGIMMELFVCLLSYLSPLFISLFFLLSFHSMFWLLFRFLLRDRVNLKPSTTGRLVCLSLIGRRKAR
jgi:hypothetical protein